ncbi:hypothetical protein [Lacticaseibacillus saniviri]
MTITGMKVYKFVAIVSALLVSLFMLLDIFSGVELRTLMPRLTFLASNLILYQIITKPK